MNSTSTGTPANPGEFDYGSVLRDQRVRAVMWVKDSGESVRVLSAGGSLAPARALARLRGWGQQVLTDYLPAERMSFVLLPRFEASSLQASTDS